MFRHLQLPPSRPGLMDLGEESRRASEQAAQRGAAAAAAEGTTGSATFSSFRVPTLRQLLDVAPKKETKMPVVAVTPAIPVPLRPLNQRAAIFHMIEGVRVSPGYRPNIRWDYGDDDVKGVSAFYSDLSRWPRGASLRLAFGDPTAVRVYLTEYDQKTGQVECTQLNQQIPEHSCAEEIMLCICPVWEKDIPKGTGPYRVALHCANKDCKWSGQLYNCRPACRFGCIRIDFHPESSIHFDSDEQYPQK